MKKSLLIIPLMSMIALPLVMARPMLTEPCGGKYKGNCTTAINEAIVAGPGAGDDLGDGVADMKWSGRTIQSQLTYTCEVVSLNGTNFKVMSGTYGITPTIVIEHWDQIFDVTAVYDGEIGFIMDARGATNGGKTNGAQVTLVCYDVKKDH